MVTLYINKKHYRVIRQKPFGAGAGYRTKGGRLFRTKTGLTAFKPDKRYTVKSYNARSKLRAKKYYLYL